MVDPDKDVDGFHSINIARLVSRPVMDSSEISEIFEEYHGDRGNGDGDSSEVIKSVVMKIKYNVFKNQLLIQVGLNGDFIQVYPKRNSYTFRLLLCLTTV